MTPPQTTEQTDPTAPPVGIDEGSDAGHDVVATPRRGRPKGSGKLDEALIERICTAIAAGNTLTTAAALAGVSDSTVHRWMAAGRSEESGDLFWVFREEVQKARAVAEARAVQHITRAAGEGQWTAAAWFLERTNPNQWGKKDRVEVSGPDGAPLAGGSADDARIIGLAAAVAQRAREAAAIEAGPAPLEGREVAT